MIGPGAFFNCEAMKFIYIPASISTIRYTAFSYCENLSDVYYGGSKKAWNTIVERRVEYGNEVLGKAEIHYESDVPNYVVPTPTPTPPAVTPTPTPPAGNNPFTDVPNDAWYAAPVLWAKANNITGGKTETTFGPDDGCTRAQVVTFLWAANGKPEPKSMNNPFKDVANNAWYLKPVLWAVEQGITGGIAEGKFGPEQTCTRAQIATFLYAAAGKPEVSGKSSFKDVKDADWFAKPIIWAAQNEVTGGIGDGKFGPNNTCTRAQVVTFLYKVYGNN